MALCDEDMQKYRKCLDTVFTGISYKLSGDTSGQLYLNAPLGEGNLNSLKSLLGTAQKRIRKCVIWLNICKGKL